MLLGDRLVTVATDTAAVLDYLRCSFDQVILFRHLRSPFNVDSETAEKLLAIMEGLNRNRGVTFVFSTHDPRVMERAGRLLRMVDGRIESDEKR